MPTAAGYSTVENIAGMFPTFVRGISQQKPADSLIVQYAVDEQGKLDAILQKRFQEQILTFGSAAPANFVAWQVTWTADILAVLEKANRLGAAVQLGNTLASFGVAGARDLVKGVIGPQYDEIIAELRGLGKDDKPRIEGGLYDHLFDPLARSESVRPGLGGVAGADQPPGPRDEGTWPYFRKYDRRED